MLKTVIRLLTSLLMLWATPGYCRTEWERAVLRLDDQIVESKIKTPSSSTSTDTHNTGTYSLAMNQEIPKQHTPPLKSLFKAMHLEWDRDRLRCSSLQ